MFKIPFTGMPGFIRHDKDGLYQLFYEQKPAIDQYHDFKNAVYSAVDQQQYLPIMRMCDGEYIYSIGKKKGYYQGWITDVKISLAKILKVQRTSWGESYTRLQNRILKKKFPGLLKEIAKHGYIANHFMYSPSHFCEEYIEPMQHWYRKNGIGLNAGNYTAFYFVYVLLNGPDSLALFKNRSILVLSSFDESKRKRVEQELKRRGAGDVFFHPISASSSMMDQLELSAYAGKVRLVLIAAGIGSANILVQCQVLQVPCIDSGFCLECLANPAVRSERIYGVPDQEF